MCRSAGPSAATIPPRTIAAAPTPISVDRHPRTTPTASTIVNASTASTPLAKNVVRKEMTSVLTAAADSDDRRARCAGGGLSLHSPPARDCSDGRLRKPTSAACATSAGPREHHDPEQDRDEPA